MRIQGEFFSCLNTELLRRAGIPRAFKGTPMKLLGQLQGNAPFSCAWKGT
jgi:hypothetical protein